MLLGGGELVRLIGALDNGAVVELVAFHLHQLTQLLVRQTRTYRLVG